MIRLAGGSVAVIRDGEVRFEKGDLWFDPVLNIILPKPVIDDAETIDCTGMYITPGFFDSHIHGSFGTDISDCTPEDIVKMSCHLASQGISDFLPTTMTMSEERLRRALKAVLEACGMLEDMPEPHARISGVHLEGPFLSSERAGVQDKLHMMLPSAGIEFIRDLENEFPGLIKIIDIAPELEGAEEFCTEFADKYVLSAAHTAADYKTGMRFFANGGASVTHMLNAMESCHKRAPGMPGAAYDSKEVFAEVICDGEHIEPTVLRMLFELFEGRLIVVSDAMSAAGMPDGEYSLGGLEVKVKEGKAYNNEGKLAGSVTTVTEAAKRLYGYGIERGKIIEALTVTPYRRLKMTPPELVPGGRADINIFDEDMRLVKAFISGKFN